MPERDAKGRIMRYIALILLLLSSSVSAETMFELVERNKLRQVTEALEAKPELVNRKQHKVSLLHVACFKGAKPMAILLLDRGAELEAVDLMGSTSLHRAFANGYGDLGLVLLERGAALEHSNKNGVTPFMVAARSVDPKVLTSLIPLLKSLETVDGRGRTALHHSMEDERWENVQAMLDAGANINHQDKKGRTLLHKAVLSGHRQLAELLLKAEISEEIEDERGRTALQLAQERRDSAMFNLLKPKPQPEETSEGVE